MILNLLNVIFIFNLLFVNNFCLKLRTPSIFGRRMSQIDRNLRLNIEGNDIVPDVIDSIPLNKVQIRYSNGIEVDLGNELTPMSVKDQPSVEWSTQIGEYYTLVMIDPDAPSRNKPTRREIKHWLVINIPGIDVTKGETLASYRGPSPSNGTGLHRYVFLIFHQPRLINESESVVNGSSQEGRTHFNTRVFAKTYNLGEAVAANFFVSQYDDYVGLIRANKRIRPKLNNDTRRTGSLRRAQLLDWAPRKPKAPKFPQMICINFKQYQQIQELLKNRNQNNEQ